MIRTIGLLLLLLLKILGWTLLFLLLLLTAIVLLVLFVPVRYDLRMQNGKSTKPGKDNPIAGLRLQLKVNWLLHLAHVSVSYGPEGIQKKIRVIGIDVQTVLAAKQKRREGKERTHEAKADETAQTKMESENGRIFSDTRTETDRQVTENAAGEEVMLQTAEVRPQADAEEQLQLFEETYESETAESRPEAVMEMQDPHREKENSKTDPQKRRNRSKKRKRKKDSKTDKRKKLSETAPKPQKESGSSGQGIFTKIRMRLCRLHKEFTDEVNRHAAGRLWKELLKLLRSYKPRKLKADLTFSLANPALTGEAVGVISLMPWIYRYSCSIIPDFTSEKLYIEGEILARGKVAVYVLVLSLLRLWRDKEFMQVVRRLMKRDGS